MEAYTSFAEVYDLFMDNVPYQEWGDYLCRQLKTYGVEKGLVLDLGCGTGTMTRYLRDRGYDMIGVDASMEMLDIARERGQENILYLMQEMQAIELYGTVAAAVSVCDCLNYLLSEEELLQCFKLVNNYLDPEGIFIFDMNTEYKYQELLGEETFAENRPEGSFIWENYFDPDSQINQYDLTLYIKEEENYRRFEETHYQKAYSLETVKALLEKAGLELLAVYDAYTEGPLREDSDRMTLIARESPKGQEGKRRE